MDDNCVFCQVAAGTVASDIVYQDDEVVAFSDLSPVAPLHLLVVPREHIQSLNEADPNHAKLLGRLALVAAKLAKDNGYDSRGYRLVFNTGREAGQTVSHIHGHLLAGRYLAWPPG